MEFVGGKMPKTETYHPIIRYSRVCEFTEYIVVRDFTEYIMVREFTEYTLFFIRNQNFAFKKLFSLNFAKI